MSKTSQDRSARQLSPDDDTWSQRADRLHSWHPLKRSHAWRPPTDVLENEDAYEVLVEIAGMRGAEFTVSYEAGVLSIIGVRADLSAKKAYHQMEIAYGEFATEVKFDTPIEVASIEASYNDGFLRVVLPKAKPHQISIE
jgi:HSP20 family protein